MCELELTVACEELIEIQSIWHFLLSQDKQIKTIKTVGLCILAQHLTKPLRLTWPGYHFVGRYWLPQLLGMKQ